MDFAKIAKWVWQPSQDLQDSIKIKDGGYSARKICGYSVLIMFLYGNYKIFHNHDNQTLFVTTLIIDSLFILLCLGLVTFAEIIKFKNGGNADGDQANKVAIPPVISATDKPNPQVDAAN